MSGVEPDETTSSRPTAVGWGIGLIAIGVIWILALAGVTIRWELVLPIALIGIGLVVLTVGRRGIGDGLVGLGVVVAVIAILVPTSAGPPPISAGGRDISVVDLDALEPEYTLGAGSLELDLRDLDAAGMPVEVRVRVGMGELVVRVPEGASVDGDARVGLGEVRAFGQSRGGVVPTLSLSSDGDDRLELQLDLQVGMGRIEVTR